MARGIWLSDVVRRVGDACAGTGDRGLRLSARGCDREQEKMRCRESKTVLNSERCVAREAGKGKYRKGGFSCAGIH